RPGLPPTATSGVPPRSLHDALPIFWGMTFALDDGKSAEGPLAVFDSEFALLEQRLTARLVERLQQERDPARRDLVYGFPQQFARSEEHTSALQSLRHRVCRRLLEKK